MLILNCVTGKGGAIFVSMCGGCENHVDTIIFTQLFFLKRKQIALMTGANLRFASPLRDKSFRNED